MEPNGIAADPPLGHFKPVPQLGAVSALRELDGFGGAVGPLDQLRLLWPLCRLTADDVVPQLRAYAKTDGPPHWAERHWPWVVLLCARWRIRAIQHEDAEGAIQHDDPERSTSLGMEPADVRKLLSDVIAGATQAGQALDRLGSALLGADLLQERGKASHISWLLSYVFLASAADYELDEYQTLSCDAVLLPEVLDAQRELLPRLARLVAASKRATSSLDDTLLKTERLGVDPSLTPFVAGLSAVWLSLTGNAASAAKARNPEDRRSPFVRFVCDIADAENRAGPPLVAPTEHQIAAALRRA